MKLSNILLATSVLLSTADIANAQTQTNTAPQAEVQRIVLENNITGIQIRVQGQIHTLTKQQPHIDGIGTLHISADKVYFEPSSTLTNGEIIAVQKQPELAPVNEVDTNTGTNETTEVSTPHTSSTSNADATTDAPHTEDAANSVEVPTNPAFAFSSDAEPLGKHMNGVSFPPLPGERSQTYTRVEIEYADQVSTTVPWRGTIILNKDTKQYELFRHIAYKGIELHKYSAPHRAVNRRSTLPSVFRSATKRVLPFNPNRYNILTPNRHPNQTWQNIIQAMEKKGGTTFSMQYSTFLSHYYGAHPAIATEADALVRQNVPGLIEAGESEKVFTMMRESTNRLILKLYPHLERCPVPTGARLVCQLLEENNRDMQQALRRHAPMAELEALAAMHHVLQGAVSIEQKKHDEYLRWSRRYTGHQGGFHPYCRFTDMLRVSNEFPKFSNANSSPVPNIAEIINDMNANAKYDSMTVE